MTDEGILFLGLDETIDETLTRWRKESDEYQKNRDYNAEQKTDEKNMIQILEKYIITQKLLDNIVDKD